MKDMLKDALNEIDDTYIAEAAAPYKSSSMVSWLIASAAMLVLLIGIALMLGKDPGGPVQMESQPGTSGFHPSAGTSSGPHIDPSSAPTQPDAFTVPLVDQLREPQKITGMQHFGAEVYPDVQEIAPYMEFWVDMVVEAKVVEILPDVYRDPFYGYSYYVLVMETLDAFNVENMPKLFYYRLSYPMSPNLDQFDSLILTFDQVGIEDYLMVNTSNSTYETFNNMFETRSNPVDWGSVIAFRDGVIDLSLWNLPYWYDMVHYFEYIDQEQNLYYFPAKSNSTIEECKENIRNKIDSNTRYQSKQAYTQADIPFAEVFAYVEPFKNGVFFQIYEGNGNISFHRLINGMRTNESIWIWEGKVTYSTETYTKEDLSALPDLGALMVGLSTQMETMTSPNAEYYLKQGVELVNTWAKAKYYKQNGAVYGIVTLCWQYGRHGIYSDIMYYLVTEDGTCRIASEDEIYKLQGIEKPQPKPPLDSGNEEQIPGNTEGPPLKDEPNVSNESLSAKQ